MPTALRARRAAPRSGPSGKVVGSKVGARTDCFKLCVSPSQTDCLTTEPTRIESQLPEGKLLGFYAHIGELSKVLIEGGQGCLFGRSGRGKQAVHEMDLRFSIAFQCVEVNGRPPDLNTRAGDELAECRGNISAWMLIERLQYKHALGRDSWQHHKSPRRRGRRYRTAFQRPWHAFHGPVLDSERSDWCPRAFACSPNVPPTTGSFSGSLADLCEGHPLALLTGEHTLQ